MSIAELRDWLDGGDLSKPVKRLGARTAA